jgi:shikimate dehydrogenase
MPEWRAGASTRLAGVMGCPVRHSLSPAIHNAAFRATDLDWVYVAFEVPPAGAAAAVAAMGALGIEGLNVTMPHKAGVAEAVDRLSPVAGELGAVNTVVREAAALVGHNTDGDGLVAALRAEHGFDPAGRRCLILGAGGTGRAVARALGAAGAADVAVVARRSEQAKAVATLAGPSGRTGAVMDAGGADLVVNTTPVAAELPLGLEPSHLGPAQLVVDVVYQPRVTALLLAAAAQGAATANGVGMLVHQAALAFRLWTGHEAPVAEMRRAAADELVERGG